MSGWYGSEAHNPQDANEWALECKKIKEEKVEYLRDQKPEEPKKPDPVVEEHLKFHKDFMAEAHKEYIKDIFKQHLAGELSAEDYKKKFREASDRGEALLEDIERSLK